jgi:hypothetical protein
MCVCVYVDFPRRRGATWDNLEGVFIQPSSVLVWSRRLCAPAEQRTRRKKGWLIVSFYLKQRIDRNKEGEKKSQKK